MPLDLPLSGLEDDKQIPASELIKAYLPEQRPRGEWRERGSVAFFYFMIGICFVIFRSDGIPFTHIRLLHCGPVLPVVFLLMVLSFPIMWHLSKPTKKPYAL